MSDYKVLTINTYGGSLLLAAKLAGLPVIASLEDSGFGSDLQRLNFPDVPVVENLADWPAEFKHPDPKAPGRLRVVPWSKTVVIAHPPCAAFSNQNQQASKKGTDTAAFACHVNVIDYALGHGAAALALESVPGALRYAKEVYTEQAAKHGYQVFFVLQNAVSFGVPQWRPRFWAWFIKKKALRVGLDPQYRLVEDCLRSTGTELPLASSSYVTKSLAALEGRTTDEWSGNIFGCLEKEFGMPREPNFKNVRERLNMPTGFVCAMPRFYQPTEFCATIMSDSWWYARGRQLYREEYCELMGFPADYQWGKREKQFRTYLSKGICPPVGAWVLKQLVANLEKAPELELAPHEVKPGEILDLQPKKAEALAAARQTKIPDMEKIREVVRRGLARSLESEATR